jgi:hypothetical protein
LKKQLEETTVYPTEAIQITTMAGCSAVKIIRNRTAILKKNQMTTEELTIEVHKALEIRPS